MGGKNIKELSIRQLSELVSFVTQDNFLFNCSLKENIRLGNPNATDEEVYAAAKAACCDEFIVRLDKGYDTPAGDAGKRLSGGEKQRIAIARAILKNAPIVILDEATAFTDPQNEDKIQKSIMALSKGKNSSCDRPPPFHHSERRSDCRVEKRPDCGLRKAGRIVEAVSALCGYVESPHRGEELVCE